MNSTRPNMTEQELLTDFLSQEKQLVKDYAGDVTEASCENLRQLLLGLDRMDIMHRVLLDIAVHDQKCKEALQRGHTSGNRGRGFSTVREPGQVGTDRLPCDLRNGQGAD